LVSLSRRAARRSGQSDVGCGGKLRELRCVRAYASGSTPRRPQLAHLRVVLPRGTVAVRVPSAVGGFVERSLSLLPVVRTRDPRDGECNHRTSDGAGGAGVRSCVGQGRRRRRGKRKRQRRRTLTASGLGGDCCTSSANKRHQPREPEQITKHTFRFFYS